MTKNDKSDKKYYLKHKWFNYAYTKYLCYDKDNDEYFLFNLLPECGGWQVKFTKNEIEEIKSRFDTDLKDYRMIEVNK